jgi:predicted lipid-binding transport protein (Tim44 family)
MRSFGYRPIVALCAAAMALALVSVQSDARSRVSAGSRGSQTWSAPPTTKTAPNTARPVERTMAQPGQPGAAARPGTPAQQPGGFFNRPGLLGGLAAGFLGAGLLGMLFGNGLFGGLGGLASMFGLLLQIGLVAIVGYMAWNWWQRRNQSQHAYAGGPSARNAAPGNDPAGSNSYARNADGGERPAGALGGALGGFGGGFGNRAAPNAIVPFKPTGADFDVFERLLGEVQTAYSAEDIDRLGQRVTPEMLSYFAAEFEANKHRGVVNRISDVKLLQGDLSEAWGEGNDEYATVALRYSLVDETLDRPSGRVVEGGADEATEIWTFLRPRGGEWQLSAIQQTA